MLCALSRARVRDSEPPFCIREMGRLRTEDGEAGASPELCAQASGAPCVTKLVKPWSKNKERKKVMIFLQIVMFF